MTLIALQLILPLALLAWLALRPARSWVGLGLQLLSLICLLSALQLSALWLMPPWWTIWVYWLLLAIAFVLAVRRPPRRATPRGFVEWAAAALFVVVAAYSGWTAAQAWAGRQIPKENIVDLQFPLNQGIYLVANGGTDVSVSSHAMTFARATPRQLLFYGQSHAVDLVALNRFGLTARGFSPPEPELYEIFGHAVLAPCDGRIVQSANDRPDMQVPIMDMANMVGNHVLLRCRDADVLLAHFRRGSVRVRSGQQVSAGRPLGEVGNSGNSSTPHLHIHAQEPGPPTAPFSGKPLPMTFGGLYLVRGNRIEAQR